MLMTTVPFVSVIIPVYNAGDYLPHCLDSLLQQPFEAFELVLIDDGSTDGSADLADRYARRDARVRVIHQPNQGVSAARNRGLDAARGQYVAFVDADDWVESGYFEQLAAAAEGYDVLYFGVRRSNPRNETLDAFQFEAGNSRQTPLKELIGQLAASDSMGLNCLAWIRRELLEKDKIRFPEGIQLHEDFLFTCLYLLRAGSLAFCSYAPYVYMDYSCQKHQTLSGKIPDNYQEIGLRSLALFSEVLARTHLSPRQAEELLRKKREGFYIGCIEVVCRSPHLSVREKIRQIRALRPLFQITGRIRRFDGMPWQQRIFQAVLNTRNAFFIWAVKTRKLQQKSKKRSL